MKIYDNFDDFLFPRNSFKNYYNNLISDNKNENLLTLFKVNEDLSLTVCVDMPGADETSIDIEVLDKNTIKLTGERKSELYSYSINKNLYIPEGYNLDNVSANLKNGILTLLVPTKNKEDKVFKKIKINH